jgi:excinuclease ABC subunit C
LTELQQVLGLPVWPRRIECYDVAHLQGTDVAGAMVVFEQGVPQKKEYRRFQIRTVSNDDYGSMDEMLTRRFKRSAAERSAAERAAAVDSARNGDRDEPAPGADFEAGARLRYEQATGEIDSADSETEMAAKAERDSDPEARAAAGGWAVLPDLIVIDGGKGQLARAYSVLQRMGLRDIPMISLAKRDEEIFLPGRGEPVVLEFRSEALRLLQRVRDEAHRFSNTYNRKLGARRATKGKLDSVPFVGPTRKKALIWHCVGNQTGERRGTAGSAGHRPARGAKHQGAPLDGRSSERYRAAGGDDSGRFRCCP